LLAAPNGSTAASAPPLDQCRFVAEDFEEFVSEVLGIEWLVGPRNGFFYFDGVQLSLVLAS
jgi:hypothetical protein